MDPAALLNGIYYGDEGVKEIVVDGYTDTVKVKITRITWLEAGKKPWECKLSVEDPWLVFSGAQSIRFEPSGLIPNDFVEEISVLNQDAVSGLLTFAIRTGNARESISILINARDIGIEHPMWPL